MHLYIEGHNTRRGYAISRTWSDAACARFDAATEEEMRPVRFVQNLRKAKALVERWNRRFGAT